MSEQYQFDFKDWQEAFAMFYRKRLGWDIIKNGKKIGCYKGNPNIVFIISTGSYTSGYWIEEKGDSAKNDEHTRVYRSVKSVRALEKRLKDEIENSRFADGRYPMALSRLVV